MSKGIPSIQKFMTSLPHSIGLDQTLAKAQSMMKDLRIRHLPVLSAGKLVGVITERDLQVVGSFSKDADPHKIKIEEAFVPEPYTVSPNAQLDEVCREMAEKKYGCALVVDNDKLVGIFTWIDALKAMANLLETRLK